MEIHLLDMGTKRKQRLSNSVGIFIFNEQIMTDVKGLNLNIQKMY